MVHIVACENTTEVTQVLRSSFIISRLFKCQWRIQDYPEGAPILEDRGTPMSFNAKKMQHHVDNFITEAHIFWLLYP